MFGVEQGLSLPPDVLAVAVELVAGDLVDRLALPLRAYSVVNPCGVHRVVIEQLPQHVDRDAGVGVSLGVGMTVGIGEDVGFVELDLGAAVSDQRWRQSIHPLPVAFVHQRGPKSLGAQRIHFRRWQQLQTGQGLVGKAVTHSPLLVDDQRRSGVGDGQFPPPTLALQVS